MARYDKYEPLSGGHRAQLAADWPIAELNTAVGVGLDASGNVVQGAGNTGLVGVVVLTKQLKAGDVVDIMQDGDIVEFDRVGNDDGTGTEAPATARTPGTPYFASTSDGTIGDEAAAGSTAGAPRVGYTVRASHLVVRFGIGAAATT